MRGRQRRRQVTELPFELRIPLGGVVHGLLHTGERGLPVHRELARTSGERKRTSTHSGQRRARRLKVSRVLPKSVEHPATLRRGLVHLVAQPTCCGLGALCRRLVSLMGGRGTAGRGLDLTLGASHTLLRGDQTNRVTGLAGRFQLLLRYLQPASGVRGPVLRGLGLLLGGSHLLRGPLGDIRGLGGGGAGLVGGGGELVGLPGRRLHRSVVAGDVGLVAGLHREVLTHHVTTTLP